MIEGMNCYLEDSRDSAYFSKTMYTEVSLPAINQRFVDFLFCLNIPLNVVLLKTVLRFQGKRSSQSSIGNSIRVSSEVAKILDGEQITLQSKNYFTDSCGKNKSDHQLSSL